jgi:hypothetical protein
MPEDCSHEFDMPTTERLFAAYKSGEQPHCPSCQGPDSLVFKPTGNGFEIRGAKSWNVRCPNLRCQTSRNFMVLPDGRIVPIGYDAKTA